LLYRRTELIFFPTTVKAIHMHIVWTILIGFVAGIIAKVLVPGDRELSGFILTALLGVVGAFVASWLGQQLHIYGPNEGAGLVGAILGAVIVLLGWGAISRR
jgi:uncharacterized membrane protein YeaQ/YmgE (transglycosylase-associated protein family)